jgi:hypothetical protein
MARIWRRHGPSFLTEQKGEPGMTFMSKPFTAAIAITGAAILIPTVALASTSHPAAPRRAAVTAPACANAHPASRDGAFVWAGTPADGFAGGNANVMEITNEGRRACSLRGTPGAAVEGSNGHLIGSPLPASSKGPLVTLKPGATAYFVLTIHVGAALCAHPVNGDVVIYLPGQRQAQLAWLEAQACPGMRGGGVLVPGIIKPGTGIPFYDA